MVKTYRVDTDNQDLAVSKAMDELLLAGDSIIFGEVNVFTFDRMEVNPPL